MAEAYRSKCMVHNGREKGAHGEAKVEMQEARPPAATVEPQTKERMQKEMVRRRSDANDATAGVTYGNFAHRISAQSSSLLQLPLCDLSLSTGLRCFLANLASPTRVPHANTVWKPNTVLTSAFEHNKR